MYGYSYLVFENGHFFFYKRPIAISCFKENRVAVVKGGYMVSLCVSYRFIEKEYLRMGYR